MILELSTGACSPAGRFLIVGPMDLRVRLRGAAIGLGAGLVAWSVWAEPTPATDPGGAGASADQSGAAQPGAGGPSVGERRAAEPEPADPSRSGGAAPSRAEGSSGWSEADSSWEEPSRPQPAKRRAADPVEGVRRDPRGITGISPYWEALRQGDRSFLVRDYATALAEYGRAAALEPRDSEGHLRMAEAQIALGRLLDAKESLAAGLRFAGDHQQLRARAVFLLADLAERRGAWDEALAAWQGYLALADEPIERRGAASSDAPVDGPFDPGSTETAAPRAGSPATLHVATARARIERIEARKKAIEEYAAVRERVRRREQTTAPEAP